VEIEGDLDPRTNFLLDFYDLGRIMDPLIEELDHSHLNYILPYPTSEVLALLLMNVLKELECPSIETVVIRVSETQKTWATVTVQDIWELQGDDTPGEKDEAFRRLIGFPSPDDIICNSIVKPWREVILEKQQQWVRAVEKARAVAVEIKAGREALRK